MRTRGGGRGRRKREREGAFALSLPLSLSFFLSFFLLSFSFLFSLFSHQRQHGFDGLLEVAVARGLSVVLGLLDAAELRAAVDAAERERHDVDVKFDDRSIKSKARRNGKKTLDLPCLFTKGKKLFFFLSGPSPPSSPPLSSSSSLSSPLYTQPCVK